MVDFRNIKLLIALLLVIYGEINASNNGIMYVKDETLEINRCKDVVKQIMTTQSTCIIVDLGQDFIALTAAFALHTLLFLIAEYLYINKIVEKHYDFSLVLPLFPIIRYLLSENFGKSGPVDKGLNELLSSPLSRDGLRSVGIDIQQLEKKIISLNNQKCEEYIKLVVRLLETSIVLLVTYISTGGLRAVLIELVAIAYVMYTQSAFYKKSSRMKKLEKLKQLLLSA